MIEAKRLTATFIAFAFFFSAFHCENVAEKDNAKVVITERADRKSGITKRTILIGSKVCGKNGFVDKSSGGVTVENILSKRQDIDLDSLHKDLHPERTKDEVATPTKLIKHEENAPAVVLSKTDKEQGWFARLNRCCIDHENCDKFIAAKSEKFGFKNDKDYTVYDCKCDDSFAECLKYADSHTADAVGDLYFNVLKMPCINFGGTSNETLVDNSLVEKVKKIVEERLKERESNIEREAKKEKDIDIGKEVGSALEKENEAKENTDQVRKESIDPTERKARYFNHTP